MTGCEIEKVQMGDGFGIKLSQKMYCEAMNNATHGEFDVDKWTMDLSNKDKVTRTTVIRPQQKRENIGSRW